MLNLNELIVLKPTTRTMHYGISILERGKINLNGKLNQALTNREAEIRISKDGNILILNPEGKIKYKFPKSGSVKNEEISSLLRKERKEFPVHYTVEWDEEQKIWIGVTAKVGKIAPSK